MEGIFVGIETMSKRSNNVVGTPVFELDIEGLSDGKSLASATVIVGVSVLDDDFCFFVVFPFFFDFLLV